MSIEQSIQDLVTEHVENAMKRTVSKLNSDNHSLSTRLEWTEKKLSEALEQLKSKNNSLFENELSGDKIDGGTITNFSSTGIKDEATKAKITIKDGDIVVDGPMHVEGKFAATEIMYYQAVCEVMDVKNSVRIGGNEVSWSDRLGNAIKKSKLQEVGILKNLNVADIFTVENNKVGVNTLLPGGPFAVAKDGLEVVTDVVGSTPYVGTITSDKFSIGTNREPTLFVSHDNKIGIKVKAPKEDLEVAGPIRYQGQTHRYEPEIPNNGSHSKGDICWNSEPEVGVPLGWVCIKSGAPGTWRSFGNIS